MQRLNCLLFVSVCFIVCHTVHEFDALQQNGFQNAARFYNSLIEGAFVYITTQTGELWNTRSPLGAKMLKGVKNRNAFLVHCLTERGEIWHG